ncbi:polyprenyl synthetase family protein [Candidatus Sulfidibacterium hydrothermale]|uniref:polyprenyl synthetase family protein n=1 Tax=Candidatus Sulfidibacterium hydrothermale TaxID=2875962 RepID=UPI001F0A118D|nr:polyprenyl synthetase family protein [Candidatus Sulfidibacterium hydrothermale]UBM62171.1 polyprenyl synthetase family protein [Candidatus Sulfidibacterium hydrothermale]
MTNSHQKHSADELKAIFEDYLFTKGYEGFPKVLYEPALQIMKMKAKRIRPVLLLTACEAFGGDISEALDTACAIETYHNFTLVHDDIIDKADIRRNETTVHKAFGVNKAILTGDAMLLHAIHLINKAPRDKHFALMTAFEKVAAEVIEGEQYDVDFEDIPEVSLEEYMNMIRLKTSVLLAAALHMGAILGGASAEDQKNIYNFGEKLGLAFQIKDDYLDTFGDQKTFGKRIGGDILQNKKTYLLCLSLTKADDEQRRKIFDLFDEKDEEKKIAEMKAVYEALDVHKDTFAIMEKFYEEALASLKALSIGKEQSARLFELAESIYKRSF